MQTKILKACNSINTIAMYKFPGFFVGEDGDEDSLLGEDKENFKALRVLHRGSVHTLTDNNLPLYGGKFDVGEKPLKISYLEKIDTYDPYVLDCIERCAYFTESEEKSGDQLFFGSYENTYVVRVPAGVWKVELFEDYIETDDLYDHHYMTQKSDYSQVSPSVIIYTSPSIFLPWCKKDFYKIGQYYRTSGDILIKYTGDNLSEVQIPIEECTDKMTEFISDHSGMGQERILWFRFVEENVVAEYNLSSDLFYKSSDPLRHKSRKILKKSDIGMPLDLVQEEDGIYRDVALGTIVGNKRIENTPILDSKKRYEKYSRVRSYSIGDTVKVGENEYISLCDENIGNNPVLSSSWTLKDTFESSFTRRIEFRSIPEGVFRFDPPVITVPIDFIGNKKISITELDPRWKFPIDSGDDGVKVYESLNQGKYIIIDGWNKIKDVHIFTASEQLLSLKPVCRLDGEVIINQELYLKNFGSSSSNSMNFYTIFGEILEPDLYELETPLPMTIEVSKPDTEIYVDIKTKEFTIQCSYNKFLFEVEKPVFSVKKTEDSCTIRFYPISKPGGELVEEDKIQVTCEEIELEITKNSGILEATVNLENKEDYFKIIKINVKE